MKAEAFCYWLQGYFEITAKSGNNDCPALNAAQVHTIARHLALVFQHDIDPKAGPPEHQKVLNEIHRDASDGASRVFRC